MSDVKSTVRAYIQDNFLLGARAVVLADDDSFIDQHILDSTGFLELVAFLQSTYAIVVSDDEMIPENLDSLDAISAYVARKRATSGETGPAKQ